MKKDIYVQLLNEGTKVYRPVPATLIRNNIYKLEGFEIYDPDDEEWEFKPGDLVVTKKKSFEDESKSVLVAICNVENG